MPIDFWAISRTDMSHFNYLFNIDWTVSPFPQLWGFRVPMTLKSTDAVHSERPASGLYSKVDSSYGFLNGYEFTLSSISVICVGL